MRTGRSLASPSHAPRPLAFLRLNDGGERTHENQRSQQTQRDRQKITTGSVNSVVEIQLQGNPTITAVITNDAVTDLELQVGGSACAVIKASSVLVGVCQEGQGCGCQT